MRRPQRTPITLYSHSFSSSSSSFAIFCKGDVTMLRPCQEARERESVLLDASSPVPGHRAAVMTICALIRSVLRSPERQPMGRSILLKSSASFPSDAAALCQSHLRVAALTFLIPRMVLMSNMNRQTKFNKAISPWVAMPESRSLGRVHPDCSAEECHAV